MAPALRTPVARHKLEGQVANAQPRVDCSSLMSRPEGGGDESGYARPCVAVRGTRSRLCACLSFSGVMANKEVVRCLQIITNLKGM